MTAKKDLKRKKSKKKVNKTLSKNVRASKSDCKEIKRMTLDMAVDKNRNIAIVSLIQTLIVMIVAILMVVARPKSGFGAMVLANNVTLQKNILLPSVMKGIELILAICTITYIYKAIKVIKLRKFYITGILIAATALAYCLTQNMAGFDLYSYGVIVSLMVVILQCVKMYFAINIEKMFKDKEYIEVDLKLSSK